MGKIKGAANTLIFNFPQQSFACSFFMNTQAIRLLLFLQNPELISRLKHKKDDDQKRNQIR